MSENQHIHVHKPHRLFHKLGVSLTVLCAIHCMAMPFVIALLPVAGAAFHSPLTEGILLGSSALLAGYNFTLDFRKGQGNVVPLLLLAAGFLLAALGFIKEDNHLFAILGGLFIFSGYAINWYAGRKYAACNH